MTETRNKVNPKLKLDLVPSYDCCGICPRLWSMWAPDFYYC